MEQKELDLLKRMVAIPSVSGQEAAIGEMLAQEFKAMGLQVEVHEISPGRPLVLGILEGAHPGPGLVYNGHTDTHSVDDYNGDPFDAFVKDGKLYGRGAVDMKGGLAAMICAAARLTDKRDQLYGRLIIAAVPDEELLSEGTSLLAQLPLNAHAGIVSEPTNLKIGYAMRGVTHIDIHVQGVPKHTSSWGNNENAIIQMGKILAAMDRDLPDVYAKRAHPLLGSPIFNVGMIHGGEKPNVVARDCVVTLLRRDMPGEDPVEVFREFEEVAKKAATSLCTVEVRESDIQRRPGQKRRLPMEVDPNSDIVRILREQTAAVTGQPVQEGMVPFWCDASIMTNEANIPTVVFGPGDIACAHSETEWIDVEQYAQGIDIFEKTALAYLSGQKD